MKFQETFIKDLWVIYSTPYEDERGLFSRTFCANAFREHGLETQWLQNSTSFNKHSGTLRGLHFQKTPHGENKLVRCTRGQAYDVTVDLRPNSSTYKKWYGIEISATNRISVYIPKGFAHGFLTLCDNTEIYYQMSSEYTHASASGIRWNDPLIAIDWPGDNSQFIISTKDNSLELLAMGDVR